MAAKIVYGKSKETGELVHISTVERGLSCNCVCPACGEDLVARKGTKMRHHFAHRGDVDGEGSKCTTAGETVVHYLAKEAFRKLEKVNLQIPTGVELLHENNITLDSSLSIPDEYRVECDIKEVLLEEPIPALGIVPDITIVTDKCTIYVEIYVTHRVPDSKIRKYQKNGRLAIELDFSQFRNRECLEEEDITTSIDEYIFLRSTSKFLNNPIARRLNSKLYMVKTTGGWTCIPFDCKDTGLNFGDYSFCESCINKVAHREKNGRYWSYCIKNLVSANPVESYRDELKWALGPNDVLYNMEFDWSYIPDKTKKDNEGERYRQWKKSSKK